MGNRVKRWFVVFLVVFDIVSIDLSLYASYWFRFQSGLIPYDQWHSWEGYFSYAVLGSIITPFVFAFRGLYRTKRSNSKIDELQHIFIAFSMASLVTVVVNVFLFRDLAFSRFIMALAWFLAVITIWLARLIQRNVFTYIINSIKVQDKVLIVGTGEMGRAILQKTRQSRHLGYSAVGFVRGVGASPEVDELDGLPVLGGLSDIGKLAHEYGINDIILAGPALSHEDILGVVDSCSRQRVNIKVFPDVFQIISSEVSIGDLDGLPMVTVKDVALRGWNLAIKRTMDLVVSAAFMVLFSPVMLFIGLLIRATSPKDLVFYIQERVGLDERPFPVIKFRSMKVGAEERTGPVWAVKDDPRRTKLGTFLRRFSLDETPQFINVLLGQMSVVGPRPERPVFVEQFSRSVPHYLERHREKAGLTGWAQINRLRGNVSVEERTAYDLWYVENWTPWLDLKIMLRTVIAIFRDKNAY